MDTLLNLVPVNHKLCYSIEGKEYSVIPSGPQSELIQTQRCLHSDWCIRIGNHDVVIDTGSDGCLLRDPTMDAVAKTYSKCSEFEYSSELPINLAVISADSFASTKVCWLRQRHQRFITY